MYSYVPLHIEEELGLLGEYLVELGGAFLWSSYTIFNVFKVGNLQRVNGQYDTTILHSDLAELFGFIELSSRQIHSPHISATT